MGQKEKGWKMPNSTNSAPEAPFHHFCSRVDRILEAREGQVFANLSEGVVTYDELLREMNSLDTAFQNLGLSTGDRVAIFSKNDRAIIVLFLSLLRSGFTPVIGDGDVRGSEIEDCLEVCQPAVIFADADLLSNPTVIEKIPASRRIQTDTVKGTPAIHGTQTIAELIDTQANPTRKTFEYTPEVAMLVFTSGTTSLPKAVELTYANLVAQLGIFSDAYGFDSDIKLLNFLPLHHVDGIIRGPLTALWFGGSVHRSIPFSVQNIQKILASISELKITHFISVPAMLSIVERIGQINVHAFQEPNFKFVLSSADVLTDKLWTRFEQTFNVPVVNAYGLSEVVCDALFAGPDETTRQIGTLGRPVGCNVQILDAEGLPVTQGEVGELAISGPTVMKGYFNDIVQTDQVLRDGKFLTGDYVQQTEAGLFKFVGRKKTAIVMAGVTIYPEAVTSVLANMPKIEEAVVFGVADVTRNQRLVAALVPKPGEKITSADAAAYCRENLSAERTPSEFRILESLPRTPSGKVRMNELASPEFEKKKNLSAKDVLSIAAFCFGVPEEQLSSDSTPFNTEGWDSLAHMTLIEEIELQFEIMLSASQIAQIASLGDAISFVKEATD
ncbi:AMP-binding protein [Sneathiella marina]|uniref:AMP-binding protein n=1 Tax=Sneathiella marina TaxID=2950108 RepID=A0ABY4W500_9PROT|nr:AMP-binding protein [Sneathiella marina]USG61989.1 AMP-binding protein [Sneathiella marina]